MLHVRLETPLPAVDKPLDWNRYLGSRQEQLDKHREQFEPDAEEVQELELIAEVIEEQEKRDRRLSRGGQQDDRARRVYSSDPARVFSSRLKRAG
jgi:hypothetical protein